MSLAVAALFIAAFAVVLVIKARHLRVAAATLSLGVVGVTAYPVVREPHEDSFPLSTYPMFARPRKTEQTLDYALGETADGRRLTLTPRLVGSAEVLQAQSVINRARTTNKLRELCASIAGRVAHDDRYAEVVRILIVSGSHDAVEYLVRGIRGREVERARCEVTR
ncbi:MAG: hypothetical protein SFX73_13985 [Kofleriaceae bacterium]|nr:hypothetical protein [Kofleriaceae bacterium]